MTAENKRPQIHKEKFYGLNNAWEVEFYFKSDADALFEKLEAENQRWRQMTVDIDNILRLIERVEELEAQLSAPVEVKERGEG